MEIFTLHSAALQFTEHHYGGFLSSIGATREGSTRCLCVRNGRTCDQVKFRVSTFRNVPWPRKSLSHSSNRRLTVKSLCMPNETPHEQGLLLKEKGKDIVTELRGTCIFLIGMMGSGKTTVGKLVAEALDYHFFDSDKLIEEAAGGASVAQVFTEQHEDGFRDAETEVLKQLSCMVRLVVATGGGIVVRPENWSYLRHGITVWLDVPVRALAERVVAAGARSRPLLEITASDIAHSEVDKAFAKLSNIFEVRGSFYADADAKVSLQGMASCLGHQDVHDLTPTMIAIEVYLHGGESVSLYLESSSANLACLSAVKACWGSRRF